MFRMQKLCAASAAYDDDDDAQSKLDDLLTCSVLWLRHCMYKIMSKAKHPTLQSTYLDTSQIQLIVHIMRDQKWIAQCRRRVDLSEFYQWCILYAHAETTPLRVRRQSFSNFTKHAQLPRR